MIAHRKIPVRGILIWVPAVIFALVLVPVSAAASTRLTTAASLLKSCLSTMSNEHSVHWASTTNATDPANRQPATIVITSDAGESSGAQTISFKEGTETGSEKIELVKHAAYLYGGTFALEKLDGMTAAEARHFEDVWIDIPSSNAAFSGLAAGLTVSSLKSEVDIKSPTLVGGLQPVVLGHKTDLLDSTTTTSGVQVRTELYLQARGNPLPVEEIVSAATGRTTTTFSSWGERVRVSAPRNSVPLL